MRVRLSKIEVRCESACKTIIEVRVCVRHTVKFLATQRLVVMQGSSVSLYADVGLLGILLCGARTPAL